MISTHLSRKKVLLSQVIYYQLTKKSHTYFTDSQYSTCLLKKYSCIKHLSQSGHIKFCKTPGFFFSLMCVVSSPPPTNTLGFQHSLWTNTILSKSSKFSMQSISIPSSSSVTFFSEELFCSTIWFSLKIKLGN